MHLTPELQAWGALHLHTETVYADDCFLTHILEKHEKQTATGTLNTEVVKNSKNDGTNMYGKGIFLHFPISRTSFKNKDKNRMEKKKGFITSKLEYKGEKTHHTSNSCPIIKRILFIE